MNPLIETFGEPISVYTQKQAIQDGLLIKTGELTPGHIPVVFTSNLFADVKDRYQQIIQTGLELLRQPNPEDSDYMKLRVIKKGEIWVIANTEGVTFMKPEDY